MNRFDVLVVGSGPGGLLAARACAARGLRVAVVAPRPHEPWTHRYADFTEEMEGTPLAACIEHTWQALTVRTSTGQSRTFEIPYSKLGSSVLQHTLLDGGGFVLRPGTASAVSWTPAGATVDGEGGPTHAAVVVDATGSGALVAPAARATAFQTAVGWRFEGDAPYERRAMRLMDLVPVEPTAPPTFLYAMPLPDGTWFAEETSLAARPAVARDVLERRLRARLAADGVTVRRVHDVEHCRIPLDLPVPDGRSRTVGFGAAAAFVHPSTGYQVARAAQSAPALAEALVRGLTEGSPASAAVLAWDAIWPPEARRTRRLHALGLRALLAMGSMDLGRFFEQFFSLEPADWRPWMRAQAPPRAVLGTMARVFARLDGTDRCRMLRASGAEWLGVPS